MGGLPSARGSGHYNIWLGAHDEIRVGVCGNSVSWENIWNSADRYRGGGKGGVHQGRVSIKLSTTINWVSSFGKDAFNCLEIRQTVRIEVQEQMGLDRKFRFTEDINLIIKAITLLVSFRFIMPRMTRDSVKVSLSHYHTSLKMSTPICKNVQDALDFRQVRMFLPTTNLSDQDIR